LSGGNKKMRMTGIPKIERDLLTLTHYPTITLGSEGDGAYTILFELKDSGFGEFRTVIVKQPPLEEVAHLKGQRLVDELLKNKVIETVSSIGQLRAGLRELRKLINSLLDLMDWGEQEYAYET